MKKKRDDLEVITRKKIQNLYAWYNILYDKKVMDGVIMNLQQAQEQLPLNLDNSNDDRVFTIDDDKAKI